MDHLQLKRANLVGNSMGGTLALDFALLQPDRTGAVVVVASTAGGYPVPEEDVKRVDDVMRTARDEGTGAGRHLVATASDGQGRRSACEQRAPFFVRWSKTISACSSPSTGPRSR